MRIVYVLTSLGIGGAERQTLTLAARMAARGHAVRVLVLRTLPDEWPTALPAMRLEMRRSAWSAAAGLLRARRLLRDFDPDLVHSHGFHANFLARLLRLAGVRAPLISTIHNMHEGRWLRMAAYRWTDRLSTRTTAVSEAAAQGYIGQKAITAARCVVVPNAIEMGEYVRSAARRAESREALKAEEDFIWLAVGRLTAAKDYENLLGAFARVRRAGSNARLWIAGESRSGGVEALKQLAAELGIADCIALLGLRRDVTALLDAADGFVSSSAREGMPLAVAEAMAMEKPVVATDAGGVSELVGETGRVVPVRNAAALAEAMLAVMHEHAEARGLRGQAARQRVAARFSMETRAAQWEQLYADVVRAAIKTHPAESHR